MGALNFLLAAVIAQAPCPNWSDTFPFPGPDLYVSCFAVFDDGSGPALYMGGSFTSVGQIAARGLARWNGSVWAPIGDIGGPSYASVSEFAVFDEGSGPRLFALGSFTAIGGVACAGIARWNGSTWSPLGTGVNGSAYAAAVHDDGSGPALYVGGSFNSAGGVNSRNIARWNGSTWSGLGTGIPSSPVSALASYDDGTGPALWVGGYFTTLSGFPSAYLVRWRASGWLAVPGFNASVRALALFDEGTGTRLYVGGEFSTAGGTPATRIARWDGSAWSSVGGGMSADPSGGVASLAVHDEGSGPALYAGGRFATAGGIAVNRIARWGGSAWSALGGGIPGSMSYGGPGALATFDDGAGPALYVGGSFTTAGDIGAANLARWRGSAWSNLVSGSALGGVVNALATYDDGAGSALFAAGQFIAAGEIAAQNIARWDGTIWSRLGAGLAGPGIGQALCVHDDGSGRSLFVGGNFATAGGVAVNHVARWDGTAWHALGAGMDDQVLALAVHDDGSGPALYAGGEFTSAVGVIVSHIAKLDGESWAPLGVGVNLSYVSALASFDSGAGPELYAGGTFNHAGGVLAYYIARWNGSSWSAVGNHVSYEVRALRVFDDGSGPALYAGGLFDLAGGLTANGIARWNGSAWSPLGGGLGSVWSLAVFDDGTGPSLYAGGKFRTVNGVVLNRITRWNGTSWSALGAGLSADSTYSDYGGFALGVYDDGSDGTPDLFVGGNFQNANGIASPFLAAWRGCGAPGTVVCSGDGTGAACPCGNSGGPQNGCANSLNVLGARLSNSGYASVTNDTLVLDGSGMPDSAALYFQGTSALAGGSGTAFGDGLRCAGGSVLRLGVKQNVAGASHHPGAGEARISVAGHVPASGGWRVYQVWYRNAANYCTPSTFNLSNGLGIVWAP